MKREVLEREILRVCTSAYITSRPAIEQIMVWVDDLAADAVEAERKRLLELCKTTHRHGEGGCCSERVVEALTDARPVKP